MNTIAVIPARYKSSRFPGKPLAPILGKPMIKWVYEAAETVPELSEVMVATDDDRIFQYVKSFDGNVVMTTDCVCGTDRVYQAAKEVECDRVINIQGDEPLIDKKTIQEVMSAFDDETVYVASLKNRIIKFEDVCDENTVKVITDCNNDVISYSRSIIPFNREKINVKYYRSIGVYCFDKDFLRTFVSLPRGPIESAESIEQMRIIENGYKLRMVETDYEGFGVDVPEHISIVESILKRK